MALSVWNDWLSVIGMIGSQPSRNGALLIGHPRETEHSQLHPSPGPHSVPKDVVCRTTDLWAYSTLYSAVRAFTITLNLSFSYQV